MNNNKKLNIRSEVENWAKVKFSQINFQDENIDQKHLEEIKICFEKLKITNLLMDGFSTEKLEKTAETGSGLNYS